MLPFRSADAPRIDDFRVRLTDRPGWVWGTTRVPEAGEEVFCAAGIGTVKELLGKTGDGSRLVQIAFEDPKKRPFFAAASNVLLAPPGGADPDASLPAAEVAGETVAPDVWLGDSQETAYIR